MIDVAQYELLVSESGAITMKPADPFQFGVFWKRWAMPQGTNLYVTFFPIQAIKHLTVSIETHNPCRDIMLDDYRHGNWD